MYNFYKKLSYHLAILGVATLLIGSSMLVPFSNYTAHAAETSASQPYQIYTDGIAYSASQNGSSWSFNVKVSSNLPTQNGKNVILMYKGNLLAQIEVPASGDVEKTISLPSTFDINDEIIVIYNGQLQAKPIRLNNMTSYDLAYNAIQALFVDGNLKGVIKETVDQKTIDQATNLLTKYTTEFFQINNYSDIDAIPLATAINLAQTQLNNQTKGSILPYSYYVGNTAISGSFTGDVAKARLTVNGKIISWGGTFNVTTFSYYVGNNIKAGDTVILTAYDKNDKQLDEKNVQVLKVTKGTIAADKYRVGDTTITGNYTGDVTKARLTVNGKVISWGGTFSNGQFVYYVGKSIKYGDTVTLTAFDVDEKQLDEKTIQVITGTISPATYKVGTTVITGTYTGDVVKACLTIDGKVISWGGTFSGNSFSYYVGTAIKPGSTVVLTAYDASNIQLDVKTIVM
ncbi:hypothetical protein HCB21_09705 [Listeria booriae]|uniref:immunoglobulin-like domain-containing protein n=1 Tax=Listeria booriae TaxID=1552123 RepID=UPI00162A5900|nr:immunoglobulin-like domain-containing protein [Listeria booriae]MBC2160044.1 hypothetical protein [Listeria booriae]MBC2173350.1 hypothetical protein [Listeria booriae]